MFRTSFCLLILTCSLAGTAPAQPQRGVIKRTAEATPGYTLIAPFGGQNTFLIDLDGNVVHKWTTDRKPSQAAYLLPDGSLLRTAKIPNETFNVRGGPAGGIQKFDWDGNLTWDYVISSEQMLSHHDIEPMPNGNVLVVVWEYKSRAEAIAVGRDPEKLEDNAVWPEAVLEIQQTGPASGKIVWEWHLWDHLVQSHDATKPNFAFPSERPERVDVNFMDRPIADWIHMNSVDYNPQLDQILMCGRTFDEIWVIDHSTTTAQAARSTGGTQGKGGDLLYRWGNPFAWFAGTPFDQKLYGQHDPHWIPAGRPGAGNILIFNNGSDRDQRPFSTVDEITPPVSSTGGYNRKGNEPFGPDKLVWRYENQDTLYSQRVSGAQRLPNGNTLICSGETGHVFEVTKAGKVVWDFHNHLGAPKDQSPTAGPGLGGVAMFRATRYLPNDPAVKGRVFNQLPNTTGSN
ncbi:MAG: aryl-sulfate sulfotransferase [Planctomycetaceae bacterium]|nr:aryl-sulfate sulfotransferase [Planctomycetaceae bacterium]